MNTFERHKDPRDSMNIGLKIKALEINSCAVKFKINKEDKDNIKPIDPEDIDSVLKMWQEDFFPSRKMLKILSLRGFWKHLTSVRVIEIHFRIKEELFPFVGFPDLAGDRIGLVRGSGESIIITWRNKFYELKGSSHNKYFIF